MGTADLHAAAHHEIQRLAFLALVEHDLVRQIASLVHEAVDELDLKGLQGTEQRRVLQPELAGRQRGRFQETKDHDSSRTMQPGGRLVIMNDSIVFAQQRSVKTLHGKQRPSASGHSG
jgi:hypothetical protein